MKGLSCNSNVLSDVKTEQAIDILADLGYDAIDISLELVPPFYPIAHPHMSSEDDAATRNRVRRHAEAAGLAIAALNAHTNVISEFPDKRQANFEFIKGAIQLAADLEAPVVVVGAGSKDLYNYEREYWKRAVDAFCRLLVDADRLGVKLATETASALGCLVRNLETAQKFLSYEGLESMCVLFDPAHFQVRGDSVIGAYQALADRVVHMHAKDARGDPEDLEFPPLGKGDVDFDALLGATLASGYDGYIAVEYEAVAWGYSNDKRQVLEEEKAFLDKVLSRCKTT